MQSAKSYFNLTLLKKNFFRFWPIWGTYLTIYLFMPLMILNNGWEPEDPLDCLGLGLIAALVFGVLCAMAVFSYLYSSKSVHLMHSLPIRREGLFLTNYLSGLAFMLLPNLVIFLLTLLVGGYLYPATVVLWLVAQSLMCLFFYSFAVFCAMFTGNLLALPVFYGILNGLVAGLVTVISSLLGQFLFGFAGTTSLDELVAWFTPALRLARNLGYTFLENNRIVFLNNLPALLLYGFLGLLLSAGALLIYRRRALESAGDLVSIHWVRPVFKYGVAFCAAVTVGTWFYERFLSLLPKGEWAILLPLLFWGLVGYFIADMLLRKNVKVFGKAWKGGACFCVALVALFVATNYDFFGFNNAPAREAVASVRIYGIGTVPHDSGSYVDLELSDASNIDAALALHGAIAANKNALKADLNDALDHGTYDTTDLYFSYTLTDGQVIRRQYRLPIHTDALDNPNSIEGALTKLINRPANLEKLYWSTQYLVKEEGLIKETDITLTGAKLVDVSLNVYLPGTADGSYVSVSVDSQSDRDALLAAVRADMAAGRIGVRYLTDTTERYENCYYNDLSFSFYQPAGTQKETGGRPATAIYDGKETASWDQTITVTLQTTATETLKVLERLGYTDGGQLVTWAEQMQRDNGEKYTEGEPWDEAVLRPLPTASSVG